jgi:predicted Zn-dependent peptidase
MLYECYETFYHPSNMLLFIVGPVEPDKIMEYVRSNQEKKDYKEQSEIERKFDEEPAEVAEKKQVLEMNVQSSKCLVGVKAHNPNKSGKELLKHELSLNLILDILFGKSSDVFEGLYNDGLIDETFSYDYTEESGFGFVILGGDTPDPEALASRLKEVLLNAKDFNVSEEQLERAKKKKIGAFLRSINSPEFIANQFTRYAFNDMDLFEVVPVLEKLTIKEIQAVANQSFEEQFFTECHVVPKK